MEEPRRLGNRYELGEVLGRGGMAEVYKARDIRLGRPVAVKTLRADMARDATFQARFRREARSTASLNHPDVVAVYDTGEETVDGISLPYIVMEYVDGSTLRDVLHSDERLLPERAMEIIAGVLQALDYSHRNGIVHRDIKPANIMLNRSGAVKVMDFGIARALGDIGMTMTQTSAVIGTAQYLSPEQAQGERADARSDLYSTGCLLFELLAGRPPFIGDSPVAVAYQHVREAPQPPSRYDPGVPAVADAIVLKSLGKRPDERYQSAEDMRADLERALDGRPILGATVAAPASSSVVLIPAARSSAHDGFRGRAPGSARRAISAGNKMLQLTAGPEVGEEDSSLPRKRRTPGEDSTRAAQPDAAQGKAASNGAVKTLDKGTDRGVERAGSRPADSAGAKPPSRSGDKSGLAIISASMIIVLALGVIVYKTAFTSTASAAVGTVPSIVNLSVASASTALAAKGLELAPSSDCIGAASTSKSVLAGKIISQIPASGADSTAGETVSYCLSTGYPASQLNFSVTALNAQSYISFENTLVEDGFFNTTKKSVTNPTIAAGNVIDVEDANGNSLIGESVPENEPLVILVSTGAATTTVPGGLIGENCQTAQDDLQRAHFQTAPLDYEYNQFVKRGDVISTSPGGNAPTSEDALVTITCSYGPPPSTTPTSPTPTPTSTF